MSATATLRATFATACLLALGCDSKTVDSRASSRDVRRAADNSEPIRIVATDAGFEAPSAMRPGLRHVVFENRGSQVHEGMLVKLPEGMSANDFTDAVNRGVMFPEGALDYSGPGLTSPGESTELWLRVDPGRYVLFCWNGDHSEKTKVHSFTVEGDGGDDVSPRADVEVRLVNYRFELEGELRAGVRVLRVETPGPAMHEMDLFRLHPGKTAEDVIRWRKNENDPGPAPADALGGVLDSHDLSRVVWVRRNFVPGRYLLHCAMPLTTGAAADAHKSHADLGMVREIEVEN
jgi:hypothetical protein